MDTALIHRLAREAGFDVMKAPGLRPEVPADTFAANVCISSEIARFAALVAEECAKVADSLGPTKPWGVGVCMMADSTAKDAAQAIRTRFAANPNAGQD